MNHPWVAVQRNPRSGSGRRRHRLLELIVALKRLGLRPRVFTSREKLDRRLANPEERASVICVVAAGGDGTAADVINRFPDIPVMPFPLGTENLLSRYLQIPDRGESAAQVIARGKVRLFDTALVGDRRFLLMVSAGFDGDVVHRLHAARSGNISRLTYLEPLIQSTFHYHYAQTRVFTDDDPIPLVGSLVMIFNMPVYGMDLPIIPHAEGDDGLLDVVVFPNPGSLQLISYGLAVMAGRHLNHPEISFRRARRIRLECTDQSLPIQADGDPAGFTPIDIQVQPAAMRLIVP